MRAFDDAFLHLLFAVAKQNKTREEVAELVTDALYSQAPLPP